MVFRAISIASFLLFSSRTEGFALQKGTGVGFFHARVGVDDKVTSSSSSSRLASSSRDDGGRSDDDNDQFLAEKFGGYTAKQRLREEIESPFRNVRLFFFGSSAGSAFVALYFSALATLKAGMGGYADAAPLDESLRNVGINSAGVVVCAALALREWRAGERNLKRIAKGGALAALGLTTASTNERRTVADYRRGSRVLLAVGGDEYVRAVARSLNAEGNRSPEAVAGADLLVVPVVLEGDDAADLRVGDARTVWRTTEQVEGVDHDLDVTRSDAVVAFPIGTRDWDDYLESELEQATKQGFDCLTKGFTITVKKNGKILRRTTGLPRWDELVGAMEVLDGSKFGMPGDSEKYGGP